MSFAVCPSAFIRFAVAMCAASETLGGRPNFVPLARDAARFSAVRSFLSRYHAPKQAAAFFDDGLLSGR
jgi:hypothetical protein